MKIRSRMDTLLPYSRNWPSRLPMLAHRSSEERPPPRGTDRLPPAWFLTTSTVRAPAPLGECCTPAGQDSHHCRFAVRPLGPLARRRPPKPPLPENPPSTRLASPLELTHLTVGPCLRMSRRPKLRRTSTHRDRWTLYRTTTPPKWASRTHRVRTCVAFPGACAPFEELHPCTAFSTSLSPNAPAPFTPRHMLAHDFGLDLEAFLRAEDQMPDSRCHERPHIFSFHGLLIPLRGSFTSP